MHQVLLHSKHGGVCADIRAHYPPNIYDVNFPAFSEKFPVYLKLSAKMPKVSCMPKTFGQGKIRPH